MKDRKFSITQPLLLTAIRLFCDANRLKYPIVAEDGQSAIWTVSQAMAEKFSVEWRTPLPPHDAAKEG